MTIPEILHQFIQDLRSTGWWEFIAVIAGIFSVWFSRSENILVYPTGLVNTIIYIYLSLKMSLLGEASVNVYYTALNIYGWWIWTRKDRQGQYCPQVATSSSREIWQQLVFFAFCYGVVFSALTGLKRSFAPLAIPWADAFASAT